MEQGENQQPQKKSMQDVIKEYKDKHLNDNPDLNPTQMAATANIPTAKQYKPEQFQEVMQKETDPDLVISYEMIKLPSEGLFYDHKIGEVAVEYMTSKDEDLLTTPSLIENGTALNVLLKRKIKTKGIVVEDLLPGDRNALLLFLRSSSYGNEYSVEVPDPRTGIMFETEVNLTKLQYKEFNEKPDEFGHFSVKIPMRKKIVKFRLLSTGEDNIIFKKAKEYHEAYKTDFSDYNTMKLKSHIVSIDGNESRDYINKFVDAMPARDALTIRRKIIDVQPDVGMDYEFMAKDGFKFHANLQIGLDFFFPSI